MSEKPKKWYVCWHQGKDILHTQYKWEKPEQLVAALAERFPESQPWVVGAGEILYGRPWSIGDPTSLVFTLDHIIKFQPKEAQDVAEG